MLVKNENYEMIIHGLGSLGEGVGRIDGFTIFVEGALPGETIEVKIIKLKKTYGYGKLIKILETSKSRVEPKCSVFSKCGGCNLQHLDYAGQLQYKQTKVKECIERIGGFLDVDVNETIGMENPLFYRNKAQFPVGIIDGDIGYGFYAKRSHQIIPTSTCYIQHPVAEKIMPIVQSFMKEQGIQPYNEMTHKGLVRHVVIKVGFTTNEVMVCIVINGDKLKKSDVLIERLQTIPELASVIININKEQSNVILGDKSKTIWGKPFIVDYLDHIKFQVSVLSFFQVNPVQTKILYNQVVRLADISKDDIVFDAYCGIGSISLFLAEHAKKVYGFEVVPEAIDDAKINAQLNQIDNVEFIVGETETVIPDFVEKGIMADIVVVDPPRKGCDTTLLESLLYMKPKKIVYVSCDPATLARDLKILCEEDYTIKFVQPVDCFPMTTHIETVCLLERK